MADHLLRYRRSHGRPLALREVPSGDGPSGSDADRRRRPADAERARGGEAYLERLPPPVPPGYQGKISPAHHLRRHREHLGDLLELRSDEATVYLRAPPVGDADISDRRMIIPVAEIVDWQIMFPDGSLRAVSRSRRRSGFWSASRASFRARLSSSLRATGRSRSRCGEVVCAGVQSFWRCDEGSGIIPRELSTYSKYLRKKAS